MQKLKDKVVVITGASSGIGEATAHALASQGAKLVLAARRDERLKEIASAIKANGGEACYLATDVANEQANKALASFALSQYGRVDAVFLNAGVMPNSPLAALEVKNWDLIVDINIKGVLYGIAAFLPIFTQQKSGHFIANSSVAGLKTYPGAGVYCASKWAVKALMDSLRMESAASGANIKTTTIYPAAVHSELISHITDEATKDGYAALYKAHQIPADRVASVVAYALSLPDDTSVCDMAVTPVNQSW
ncbi:SDR family oxidoreductase [Campylobacter sp. 19-13652]|uniref:SDR family oxidoreductase n=1 Tax=Campylobacter sp. 19-13652 TaxID=2840180 RepID=UPI001C7766C0|nr:SDR family oxidoreductase [Campylobacter sp. 19-13652]BCX80181.1 putative oxidoreductase Lmo0432 [Campylobacter sp. 19-13652]